MSVSSPGPTGARWGHLPELDGSHPGPQWNPVRPVSIKVARFVHAPAEWLVAESDENIGACGGRRCVQRIPKPSHSGEGPNPPSKGGSLHEPHEREFPADWLLGTRHHHSHSASILTRPVSFFPECREILFKEGDPPIDHDPLGTGPCRFRSTRNRVDSWGNVPRFGSVDRHPRVTRKRRFVGGIGLGGSLRHDSVRARGARPPQGQFAAALSDDLHRQQR